MDTSKKKATRVKASELIRVNCHVPPEHHPRGRYGMKGYRRATITVTRFVESVEDIGEFINNLNEAGQLDKLGSLFIRTQGPTYKVGTDPLSLEDFTSEARSGDSYRHREIY